MASRRTPVEDAAPAPSAARSHDMGFEADELALPRMRVVGKDARLVELGVAKAGDIAIGADAEDTDSTVYPNPGNVRFMVLAKRTNYACGYDGPKGSWDANDPDMPAEAKKQYHYTLCVPQYDTILPVNFTAGGSAASTFRRINTVLAKHTQLGAGAPYEIMFELTSEIRTATINGNQKSWPAPALKRVEPTEEELKVGAALYETVVGPGRKQLEAAAETPDF